VRLRMEVVGRIVVVDHMLAAGRMLVVDHKQVVGRKEQERVSCRSWVEEGIVDVEEGFRSNLVEEDIGFLDRMKVEEGIVLGYHRSNRCQT